jgi:hypothetical protein
MDGPTPPWYSGRLSLMLAQQPSVSDYNIFGMHACRRPAFEGRKQQNPLAVTPADHEAVP